ncbi:hypothetical protein ACVIGB_008396 [Bradyrhizobium sp. USDA 4341]
MEEELIDPHKQSVAIEDGVALSLSGGGYRAMVFHELFTGSTRSGCWGS